MNPIAVASWLLTYLIHSTVLLAGAWLASRWLGDRSLTLQEILLRTALVGGVLTASLQVGFGIEPLAGAYEVDPTRKTEANAAMIEVEDDFVATGVVPNAVSADPAAAEGFWDTTLLILWGIGSLAALIGLGRSHVDLRRLLRTRRFRPTGRLIERLAAAMGLRRKVRLSTSQAVAVPFATGIRQPEICCPERVGDLAVEHQTGLFAHELAHLARRDPVWQLFYRLGEAMFILQPLNRLVRGRLEEIAEHLTDERAVACTGDRVGLARCLVVVAHWGVSSPIGAPASALAAGPRLDRRVRNLILGSSDRLRISPWAAPLAIAAVIGAVSVLPVVVPAPAHAESSASGSEPVKVTTWSDADEAPPVVPAAPAAHAPEAIPAPVTAPAPEAAPAPVTARVPEVAPAPVAPSSVEPPPEAEAAPVPAAAPVAPADETPATPPSAPEPPAPPQEASEKQEQGETDRRSRERERVEERVRAALKARERAEERAAARALVYEERVREFAARAAELEARAAERGQLTEEQREEFRKQIAGMRAMAEARARERATEERAREAAERARYLAERAEEERIAREKQRRDENPHDQ